MHELRCPACGDANAVAKGTSLDDVRCAACESRLDPNLHVRYVVDDPTHVRGPRLYADLVRGVAEGDLHGDMRLSEEGGPWFRARERTDLFAHVRKEPQAARTPRGVPGSVMAMAALGGVMSAALFLFGVGMGLVSSAFGGSGALAASVTIFGALGFGQLFVARAIGRGSQVARALQLAAAAVVGIGVLFAMGEGLPIGYALLGLLLVAVPFRLLLNAEARNYFR